MMKNNFPKMHVSLYVSNIQASEKFYTTLFQEKPAKIKSDYLKYTLDNPNLIISFVQNSTKVNPDTGHLGFQVENPQALEYFRSITTPEMDLRDEMDVKCCYAHQDKFWLSDPDGYQWEIYYFHSDVEFNDPRTEDSQCCVNSNEDNSKTVCCEGEASACC